MTLSHPLFPNMEIGLKKWTFKGAISGGTLVCLPIKLTEGYRSESTRDRGYWFYRKSSS